MDRHGTETYFLPGEGFLGESVGGRDPTLSPADEAAVPAFRFSRMRPGKNQKQLGAPNRQKIAEAMTADSLVDGQMGAGFTYLGQFIDHDLTFDKTGVMEGVDISPVDIEQSRSPSLDLDSLYGAGPLDPGSAKFYSDGLHLKMGDASGGPPTTGFDLPRVGSGANPREALIPDPRNDENLAVAQTHLAFIRFHNRVVDTLPAATPPTERFGLARKIVTKHYQWMIRTDYLPKICAPSVVTDVFTNDRKAFEVDAVPNSMPTMPVEFSVAAFRLGHSMIRAQYSWNKVFPARHARTALRVRCARRRPRRCADAPEHLDRRLPPALQLRRAGHQSPGPRRSGRQVQQGDADRHEDRQPAAGALRSSPIPRPRNNLAFRNLLRADMVKLATGQQMATFLKSKGVTLTKLTNAQIRDGSNGADVSGLTAPQRTALLTNTPLWFYILREAEFNQGKLKGVGARIVAETFHRAMEGSKFSIVRDKAFRPSLGPNNQTFRMADLLLFAFEGKKELLNPLGD